MITSFRIEFHFDLAGQFAESTSAAASNARREEAQNSETGEELLRPTDRRKQEKGQQALMDYLRSDRKTALLDRLPLSAIQSTASSTTAKEATRTRSLLPSGAKSGRRSGKSPAQSRLDLILYLFCMFCLAALPISTTATFIVNKNPLQCTDLSLSSTLDHSNWPM